MKSNCNGKSPYLTRSVWRAGKNGNGATLPATTISRLSAGRVKHLINEATRHKVLVLGDIMLDEFIWGSVRRISPEAPVPVVQLERESFMPGGAANVARNLAAVHVPTELFSVTGRDDAGKKLKGLLSSAAGVVVGKVGTATVDPQELLANTVASQAQLTPRYGVVLGNGKSKHGGREPQRVRNVVKVSYE
jgi:pfkB family carbohydrate kinase